MIGFVLTIPKRIRDLIWHRESVAVGSIFAKPLELDEKSVDTQFCDTFGTEMFGDRREGIAREGIGLKIVTGGKR